jgi:hypothetical protein
LRVEQDRHRPVIEQFDRHVGAEHAGLDVDTGRAQMRCNRLVEFGCLLPARRGDERRPPDPARVAEQRELRDEQDRSADRGEIEVRRTRRVVEVAQPRTGRADTFAGDRDARG